MGKWVHVVKKHEEYGNKAAFNCKGDGFCNFLSCDLGCNIDYIDGDYDGFECEVSEYEIALSLMKAYKEFGRCKKVEEMFDDADGDIDQFECDLSTLGGFDYLLETMQAFYDERDKESDWISFKAW